MHPHKCLINMKATILKNNRKIIFYLVILLLDQLIDKMKVDEIFGGYLNLDGENKKDYRGRATVGDKDP